MKSIALIGMPNAGKSTLFNRLTGAHAKVGNWHGITVDLLAARMLVGGHMARLVDLPGIYDLCGVSEDEKVVTTFLGSYRPDLILFVMNATQMERQATLLAELVALGIPIVAVLTMADEARQLGITIDVPGLSTALGMPVCLLSAKFGQGVEHLQSAMRQALAPGFAPPAATSEQDIAQRLQAHAQVPAQLTYKWTERLDRILLNRWLGLPVFLGLMLLVFQAVFVLGKPLQDGVAWLFTEGRELLLEPALAGAPAVLRSLLLDGIYNGLGTVAAFVPLIVLFFVFMSLVEDTGYLARAAFLLDGLMARFGLDGRGFVMLLMGFGCNVPALMGTRIIRSRGLRWLTMMTIPFSLCSARLQVFVFFVAALFTTAQAPWVLFSLYVTSIVTAAVTALAFRHRYVSQEAFVLEIPPYRFPTRRQIFLRGWHEVQHFLRRATRFIVLGVVLVWVMTNFPLGVETASAQSWAGQFGQWLDPVMRPLGIDARLTIALVFGFVAKEIVIGSLAVIYGLQGQELMQSIGHQISWASGYSFMLFTLIYTPCLSTVATLKSESKGWMLPALSLAWSLGLAWLVSLVFYQVAIRLG